DLPCQFDNLSSQNGSLFLYAVVPLSHLPNLFCFFVVFYCFHYISNHFLYNCALYFIRLICAAVRVFFKYMIQLLGSYILENFYFFWMFPTACMQELDVSNLIGQIVDEGSKDMIFFFCLFIVLISYLQILMYHIIVLQMDNLIVRAVLLFGIAWIITATCLERQIEEKTTIPLALPTAQMYRLSGTTVIFDMHRSGFFDQEESLWIHLRSYIFFTFAVFFRRACALNEFIFMLKHISSEIYYYTNIRVDFVMLQD
ncbi:hypothetical protein ACJX0J_012590, partial [Zea mays]